MVFALLEVRLWATLGRSRVHDGEGLDNIARELQLMEKALANYRESYKLFYEAAQRGDWLIAESHRFCVLSFMESAMDAYTRACRLQKTI